MKSVSLQSLYSFCGNGELPDVLFRMEKYSFDLEVTDRRVLFLFCCSITLNKCCFLLISFTAEPIVRSSCT